MWGSSEKVPFISAVDWVGMDVLLNGSQLGAMLWSANNIDFIEILHGFKNFLFFQQSLTRAECAKK